MKPTAKEIAFRGFYDLLKSPPYAVIGYYKNLLRAFVTLFNESPEIIQEMKRRVREIEITAGIVPTQTNLDTFGRYNAIRQKVSHLEAEMRYIEDYLPLDNLFMHNTLIRVHDRDAKMLKKHTQEMHRVLMAIKPLMSLSIIERYMENNMNLKSFFKEGGRKITQFEIEEKLESLIDWMNELASEEMRYIRFSKQTIGG